ncbi:MAG: LysR family transcriptional regulator [Cyanobacteria bacterium P01_H01_bin.15]
MTDRISTLRLFCRVAITGSFTAAGKEIDLSQPSVSRIISSLEKDLGAALFVRSTHAVKLTEAGADYLARIEPILSALEEANYLVRSDGKLQGRLRVGIATSFATREIIPRLPDFLAQHPDLNVDLVLTDEFQDLIDQGIDVAVRFGRLRDSTMIARRLLVTSRLLAASPSYLAKAGIPKTPADLAGHQVIIGPSSMGTTGWNFKKDGKTLSVKVDGQLMVTVNEASTAAALAGMGIISTAFWGCRAELESGELVQVLKDWEIGTVEVNALLAAGKSAKPSAQAFADYLVASFHDTPSI